MAMEPLPSQWVNAPPTIAPIQSAFSPGGAYYPTPVNNYNVAPINGSYSYNTRYGSPYSMAPSGQQESGGGSIMGNASNIKSVGQFVGNNFSFPQSSTLNNIGSGLGFAPGTLSYTTAGALPWQAAGSVANSAMAGTAGVGATEGALGASTLSSSLGAAGIGALAGSFLGRIGGSSTGGSIGGAAGAMIGNMIMPGVGGVVGGLIGGIGGGFFGGGKQPTTASIGGLDIGADGNAFYTGGGEKNPGQYAGAGKAFANDLAGAFNNAKQYLPGITFKPAEHIGIGVNTLHSPSKQPGYVTVEGKVFGFNPNDDDSRQSAIGQAVSYWAKQSGATDEMIKSMASQMQVDATPQGQAQRSMPFVPVRDNARFADYMSKYKSQGTPNAPATS